MTVATKELVQPELFVTEPGPEKLSEYLALLGESWPTRPWGNILTPEIVADMLELDHRVFRECLEIWGRPPLPVRCAS